MLTLYITPVLMKRGREAAGRDGRQLPTGSRIKKIMQTFHLSLFYSILIFQIEKKVFQVPFRVTAGVYSDSLQRLEVLSKS